MTRSALWSTRSLVLAFVFALTLGACASEEGEQPPSAPAHPLAGTACGKDVCQGDEVCATYREVSACVSRCAHNAECGAGACCSYAHSAVGAYCVAVDDALGRAGGWCVE